MEQLCGLKVDMDHKARRLIGQAFLDDWMGSRNSCAYHGHSFLRLVLPFMDWDQDEGDGHNHRYRAYVNPHHVLGAGIKGMPGSVREEEVAGRIESYANNFDFVPRTLYIRYPALGLYWAHEGKHRVAFMRAHNQPVIAAWVQDANYPQPERIVVIAPSDERDEWLALLDERYLQVLRRPRVSGELLSAYGVKTVRWGEVPGLPDEQGIRQIIWERKLHKEPKGGAERDRTLDLENVRKQLSYEETLVEWSFFDLAPLRFMWKRYFIAFFACLVLGTALIMLNVDWVLPSGYSLLGSAIGLISGLSLLRFSGSRRSVLEKHRP
jgi:hypothetical protein